MSSTARLALLLACLASPAAVEAATSDIGGRWHDEAGNTFDFRDKHQFRFAGYQKVWVPHQGARNPISTFYRRNERGQYIQEHKELSGAWESGEHICSVETSGSVKASGNVRLFAENMECCMEARRLGTTLVLRALNEQTARTDKAEVGICTTRVLNPAD